MVPIYLAPMQGITDAIFRRVHHECFPGVQAYYIPFISPTKNLVLTGREQRNVLPENHPGVPCVPQVLTKDENHFLWAAKMLADLGYREINLNAGCPSRTVTAKGKGAGILCNVKELDYFLQDVCAHSPIPVSVKTRIGYSSAEEWDEILRVYSQYPLAALIIHPRTCSDRYNPGTINMDCYDAACRKDINNIIYNGDLFNKQSVSSLLAVRPETAGIMLGRGLVAQPALVRELNGGLLLQKEEIIHFHDRLLEELEKQYHDDIVFMKLRVIMKHLACCFESAEKIEKQIRKSRRLPELLETNRRLFEECSLKQEPSFVPDE